jgi:hypothetical protein
MPPAGVAGRAARSPGEAGAVPGVTAVREAGAAAGARVRAAAFLRGGVVLGIVILGRQQYRDFGGATP